MMKFTELPRPIKTLILFSVDAVLASTAYWLATIARFGRIPSVSLEHVITGTALAAILMPTIALALGFYKSVTRFQTPDLASHAGIVSGLCGAILATIAFHGGVRPLQAIGFGLVFALIFFAFLLFSRAAARWILRRPAAGEERVAIYGAGKAGRELAALLNHGDKQRPVLFVDDDPKLSGRSIEGLPVLSPQSGRFGERLRAKGVREVLIAIPSLKPSRRRQLLEFLSGFPFRVRSVPALGDLVAKGGKGIADLAEISVEDLLGRDPVVPLPGLLDSCIMGKTVLVTGGGGSIGSELCRQALALRPAKLLVIDHSELALYTIEQELRAEAMKSGALTAFEFILGSVTDRDRIKALFAAHSIDTVYHAAAYKHVPIVELNPVEGFRNNVFGTLYVARAALEAGAAHFVLISTDKAVRPTNVMGASKRVAELVVEALARRRPQTKFSMVRFGNVLASSGSVVPLFTKQIAAGGPITLTHPDVTRYFMTIREAVELVIQAGATARGGELFVLDMGAPVRIRELAEKMVRLSGRSIRDAANSDGDIAIEVTGLRPGEKMHEELLIDGDASGTMHPRILEMKESASDLASLESELARLESNAHDEAIQAGIRALLAKWVAGYPREEGHQERAGLRAVPSVARP
jgi:FlaA1/EpsC-like NDP-sugar epimerase